MKHLLNFFSKFNQAIQMRRNRINVSYNAQIEKMVKIFHSERRIRGYICTQHQIFIWLKYHNTKSVIQQIRPISRPSLSTYVTKSNLAQKLPRRRMTFWGRGLALIIVSTSQGIFSEHIAKKKKIGGKLICCVE